MSTENISSRVDKEVMTILREQIAEKHNIEAESLSGYKVVQIALSHAVTCEEFGLIGENGLKSRGFLSVNEVMKIFGKSRQTIINWINNGILISIRPSKEYWIAQTSVDKLLREYAVSQVKSVQLS
ncbi:MAG: helix-turn-helix domain-containing protein [Candidatus Heimdallarchaeota archaeon]|nr:helix-turn-helix domain-containing protein [Candidatus Heimdallarchaeota archaeon]